MSESFDYIVIGSGAAGSVVAARLSEAKAGTVCLIEAGGDNNRLMVNIPAGFVRNLGKPELMWQYESVAGANTAGRSVYLPQGKLLGGSTSINGLVYNRGQAQDFDHWATLGNPGWSYNEVVPFFRKSETRATDFSQYRGSTGPLRISDPPQSHSLCDKFIEAAHRLSGAPRHNDYNADTQFGTGYYQRFIHGRRRENVADRFLKPVSGNQNISVLKNTLVTKVLLNDGTACGVEVLRGGTTSIVKARCEVIVSAGTVNTPALLQRSGIGSGGYLQSLGIPVVHDLPGVGENFQDHYFVRLAAKLVSSTDSLNTQSRGWKLGRELLRYVTGRPSILTWSPSIAYAFLHADSVLNGNDSADTRPDLQFVFSHGSYRPGRVYELDNFPAVTCGFTQQRPHSKGFIKITSANVHDKPTVQPNYLADERDQVMAIKGVKIARDILQSEVFKTVYESEEVPGKAIQSDQQILDFIRHTGNTGYHLVGTSKMGPAHDPMSVVGADLKVHGIGGLRVVDASVMPTVTSSNTCAATVMIGEKGADMIINT